jgi:hypothetical protein
VRRGGGCAERRKTGAEQGFRVYGRAHTYTCHEESESCACMASLIKHITHHTHNPLHTDATALLIRVCNREQRRSRGLSHTRALSHYASLIIHNPLHANATALLIRVCNREHDDPGVSHKHARALSHHAGTNIMHSSYIQPFTPMQPRSSSEYATGSTGDPEVSHNTRALSLSLTLRARTHMITGGARECRIEQILRHIGW